MNWEAPVMTEQSNMVRREERRESPRVPMRFFVRRAGSSARFEPQEGNVSLGGVAWRGGPLQVGAQVEVRLQLPGSEGELQLRGEVLRVTEGPRSHARFVEMPVEAELAIARYLDKVSLADSHG